MGSFTDRFKLKAEPNYGIAPQVNDLKNTNPTNEKSINIDLIDCLVVDFKMRIKAKCIN